MKTTLLFAAACLWLAGRAFGQNPVNPPTVTGNIIIDADNTSNQGTANQSNAGVYNATPNRGGDLLLKGDIEFTGNNAWILHTPNAPARPNSTPAFPPVPALGPQALDDRTSLFLAPSNAATNNPSIPAWNWNAQTQFDANGDVKFSGDISMKKHLTIGDVGTSGIGNMTVAVGGTLGARKIQVVASTSPWPDYVFSHAYRLRPLSEVARFIGVHHHLPEIPSAATVQAQGLDLGQMNALLLKKVEELTLYLLELQRQNEALQQRVSKLEH